MLSYFYFEMLLIADSYLSYLSRSRTAVSLVNHRIVNINVDESGTMCGILQRITEIKIKLNIKLYFEIIYTRATVLNVSRCIFYLKTIIIYYIHVRQEIVNNLLNIVPFL